MKISKKEGHFEVTISTGQVTKISEEDLKWTKIFPTWNFDGNYIVCSRPVVTEYSTIPERLYLHRLILGITKEALVCDHKNRDKLDNRRCNLRKARHYENNVNRDKKPISGYFGVSLDSYKKRSHLVRYRVRMIVDGKRATSKRFTDPVEAAKAYDKYAKKRYGEFARLNFPDDV